MFAEHGFDGASVDAVAADAGLTKGAVYSRFPSKEALFIAAALGRDEETLAEVRGESPAEWARSWARGLPAQRRWDLLGMEFRLYGLRHDAVADLVRDWQRRSHDRLRDHIQDQLEGAGPRLRVDPEDAAALLAAVAAGVALQHHTDGEVDAERLMETMLDLLVET